MAALGKRLEHLDLVRGERVGRVDDPERRLAALDQRERRANVLGRTSLDRPACPTGQMPERGPAYLPAGTASGSAIASLPSPNAASMLAGLPRLTNAELDLGAISTSALVSSRAGARTSSARSTCPSTPHRLRRTSRPARGFRPGGRGRMTRRTRG